MAFYYSLDRVNEKSALDADDERFDVNDHPDECGQHIKRIGRPHKWLVFLETQTLRHQFISPQDHEYPQDQANHTHESMQGRDPIRAFQ